ncbi:MAG: ATP-binding cassette domain-containing protein [Candidatus Sericytochromatia bacterium]
MSEDILIYANKFSAGFAEKKVLHSISFKIYSNKINVIVGPGNSGKSTIIDNIRGTNFLKDYFWFKGDFKSKVERFSFMPQKSTNLNYSIKDKISDFDIKLKEIWFEEEEIYSLLINNIDIPLNKLNKSIERLAHLSILLSENTDILILDEPETHDFYYLEKLIKKLLSLKNKKTLIINTHNIYLAKSISDYVTFIRFGKLVESSERHKFFKSDNPLVIDILETGC